MVLDIELTPQPSGRHVARVLLWPNVVVEAASRDEALDRIQDAIRTRRQAGVEIVRVAVDEDASTQATRTWRKHAGTFPDDELYQRMLDEIQRGRDGVGASGTNA
jgi:Asp-tRNA(Asn)/Glu-tRNA(Gln) amidotransferase A subunit family amidase